MRPGSASVTFEMNMKLSPRPPCQSDCPNDAWRASCVSNLSSFRQVFSCDVALTRQNVCCVWKFSTSDCIQSTEPLTVSPINPKGVVTLNLGPFHHLIIDIFSFLKITL